MCLVKKILFYFLLSLASGLNLYAQKSDKLLTGNISDQNNMPLAGATVLAFNPADSVRTAGTTTDIWGNYRLRISGAVECFIEVSLLGYGTYLSGVFPLEKEEIGVSDIILFEEAQQIDAVTVSAFRNALRMEAGKTTIDVSNSILSAQGSLYDLLRNIPGVSLKEDGTLILNGKPGARLMLNGKPAYLSGADLVSYLQSLPTADVDKIELITSPSARYDASGNSGIVNIAAAKRTVMGINNVFNTTYQYGKAGRGNISNTFSYQNERLIVSANYYGYKGIRKNTIDAHRTYDTSMLPATGLDHIDQDAHTKYDVTINSFRTSVDYDLSPKLTVGAYAKGSYTTRHMPGGSTVRFHKSGKPADSVIVTDNAYRAKPKNNSYGLSMAYKDDKGRKFDLNTDYLRYRHNENYTMGSRITDSYMKELRRDTLNGDLYSDIEIISFQADYSMPLGGRTRIEAGIRSAWVDISNGATYYNIQQTDRHTDYGRSDDYIYRENINAGYVQTETVWDRISLKAGLRVENSRIKGIYMRPDPVVADSAYRKNYTDVFPYTSLSYNFPRGDHSLTALYNRRINRPNYRDLSPFNYIWDDYTSTKGNPSLEAEYTNNLELVYILKRRYRLTLYHSWTDNAIGQGYNQYDDGRIEAFPDNIASHKSYGIRLDIGHIVNLKWWQSNLNGIFYYSRSSWTENGIEKRATGYTPGIMVSNRFDFGQGWGAELNGYYLGNIVMGCIKDKPNFEVSVGIQKKVFGDKATVRIFANDLFQSRKYHVQIRSRNSFMDSNSRNDDTTFGFSFSYNFRSGRLQKKSVSDRTINESKRINL